MGQVREGWLIQVFISHSSTNDDIAALLEARMQAIRDKLAVYRAVAQNADRVRMQRARLLWQFTLDYGVDCYEFELVWLEKTLMRVRELSPLTLPSP